MNRLWRKSSRGQNLVEFALILPVFLLLVLFIFDISRAVYFYSVMYNAVREGARVAAVGETNVVVIKTVVVDRAFGMALDPVAGVIVTIGTDEVVVSASYEYNPVTPLISAFLPSGRLNLQAETSMRLEFNK